MKKTILIILALCLILSCTACGKRNLDYTKYFHFALVDGNYCALSVKQDIPIPEVLVVPNQYKGIPVAYTGSELISALPVKTVIFEAGVECSYQLCGTGNNCPTLEKIVFLSEDPDDSIVGKLRIDKGMALQLNDDQIHGDCEIFVPDDSVEEYVEVFAPWFPEYEALIRPLSELDAETAAYIRK